MPYYRKKPVVIEAIQWTGANTDEILEFVGGDAILEKNIYTGDLSNVPTIGIFTLEGKISASQMDFIIKGVQGEFYPCKPDIFEQTYEPVDPVLAFAGAEELKMTEDELIAKLIARQDAKRKTYEILKEKNLPIPPPLQEEFEGD